MTEQTGWNCLFVYGTLMHRLESYMSDFIRQSSELIGEGYVIGRLYDVGQYPALTAGNQQVYGEVIRLLNPDHDFEVLDRYEGTQYHRIQLPVFFNASGTKLSPFEHSPTFSQSNANVIIVWTYEFIADVGLYPIIEGGDYVQYLQQKKKMNSSP